MPRTTKNDTTKSAQNTEKVTAYQVINDQFISALEKEVLPWENILTEQPAVNLATNKQYSLINQMLLPQGGKWGTFQEWRAHGMKIRKGSKSSKIVMWSNNRGRLTMKYANVFHSSQIEGYEEEKIEAENKTLNCDQIVSQYIQKEQILIDSITEDSSEYKPKTNSLSIPDLKNMKENPDCYRVLFESLIESTAEKGRLDMELDADKQALMKEIGGSYLMLLSGLKQSMNSRKQTAKKWLEILTKHPRMIISATSKAEKAVKYVLAEPEKPKYELMCLDRYELMCI